MLIDRFGAIKFLSTSGKLVMNILYVNAYAVTRHYGGPEEGGWWFNSGSPLASIPVKAELRKGHKPGHCQECDRARSEVVNQGGPDGATFCTEEPKGFETDRAFEEWLDRIYYPGEQAPGRAATWEAYFGGSGDSSLDSSLLEAFWKSREYLSLLKVVEHLAPVNEEDIQKAKDSIQDIFGDVSEGNIYSVNGGVELQISVEDESAAYWPAERPRYE